MLFRGKGLRHDVRKAPGSIELSGFGNTGSVEISRIVERHIDMLGLVAGYRGTNGAQRAIRIAVNKWNHGFTGNVST